MPGPKHFYTPTTAATTRSGALIVADMRMNGSCAGGTGENDPGVTVRKTLCRFPDREEDAGELVRVVAAVVRV